MKKITTNSQIAILTASFALLLAGPMTTFAAGPAAVNLLSANNFSILSKTGVTNIPTSAITGNVGASPITGAAIHLTCPEVSGTIYTVDAAGPLPCAVTNTTLLTSAIGDMQTAYADAAGRTLPTATELGAGEIGGLTITPGLYKWGTDVMISNDVTLSGSATDIWVFQISGNLTIASAKSVILAGGAQASNVFWQVGGLTGATMSTTSAFSGTIMAAKAVIMQTGATLNGRAFAQTAVTLDQNAITLPTLSNPSTVTITSITTVNAHAVADGTFAHGWKYIFNITIPDTESNLSMKFGDWANTGHTIAMANNIRISSAQADNAGATVLLTTANTYSTPTLHMTGDLNSVASGKQVQVTVESAIPINSFNGAYNTNFGVQTLP